MLDLIFKVICVIAFIISIVMIIAIVHSYHRERKLDKGEPTYIKIMKDFYRRFYRA